MIRSVLSTIPHQSLIMHKEFKGFEELKTQSYLPKRSENKNKDKPNNSNEPSKNMANAVAGVV